MAATTSAVVPSARAASTNTGRDDDGEAECVYMLDIVPGIRREAAGDGFRYVCEDGSEVRDETTLARIKRLAVPPAWTQVWISPDASGHMQATGRDAKGRKQYRYHPAWRRLRDETKYHRCVAFGAALPRIRQRVDEDLARPGLPREKVLAALVRLLDDLMIRVGNQEYADSNGTFGLTTLRDRHVSIEKQTVRFQFKGKTGRVHRLELRDRRLARVIRRCRDLPGYELFQYIDEEGERRRVTAADVNAYIREISGDDFTTKDFRTWNGSVLTASAALQVEDEASGAERKRNLAQITAMVAGQLGNTPAVCRNCYMHPVIVQAYLEGTLRRGLRRYLEAPAAGPDGMDPEEAAVLAFLRRHSRTR